MGYVTPAAQRILQLKARIAELEADQELADTALRDLAQKLGRAESELEILNEAEQMNYERILQLKTENEPLKVCGTCARCRAAGVCQSDWPLREYATAHSTAYDLHSKCWRGGALGWVAYWTEPEEEKKNVLEDMKTTGYKIPEESE
jgi:hypothetical protein